MMTTTELLYLTSDEPGIGGRLKQRPEDFIVDELPLYEPSGEGDHLYLYVEKRRRLTTDVARRLGSHFGVRWDHVGYAGLKDKHAITRQWFSIEHAPEDRVPSFGDEHVRILQVHRHANKLQRGHLRANRFRIAIRDVEPAAVLHARRILDRLATIGAPNFVGEQRFGYRHDTHIQGKALLLGDYQGFLDQLLGRPQGHEGPRNQEARHAYDAGDYKEALRLWPRIHRFERQALGPLIQGGSAYDAARKIDRPHRLLMVSAFQSAIFNRLLNERVEADMLDKLVEGDVAFKHATRGRFTVRDPQTEQPRCDAFEISPSGPMWGTQMMRAEGAVAERELSALLETGVTEQHLEDSEYGATGSRRPYRMPIFSPDVAAGADEHGPYIQLAFDLPRGCFATTVLREIMKA